MGSWEIEVSVPGLESVFFVGFGMLESLVFRAIGLGLGDRGERGGEVLWVDRFWWGELHVERLLHRRMAGLGISSPTYFFLVVVFCLYFELEI